MKKKQVFSINQRIEISIEGEEVYYSTLIQDMAGSILYVAVPTLKGQAVIPPRGQAVEGRFFAGDAIYLFASTVLGLKTGDRVPLLMLQRPTSLERKQRRDYYRRPAACSLDLVLVKGDEDYEKELSPGSILPWFGAKTIDLGGGGLRFVSSVQIEKGRQVFLKIYLGTEKNESRDMVAAGGQIARIEKSAAGSYLYGVKFTHIQEKDRDRIINYIFNLAAKKVN